MKIRPAAVFSLCALVFFGVFVYQAQEWRLQARLYPYAIGFPMLALAIAQVILDLRGYTAKQRADATPMDRQFAQGVDAGVARHRTWNIFAWIFGFFLSIWLLGFSLSVPLLVFTYLKIQSREPWPLSVILTASSWLIFYGLFIRLLNLPFPEGLVFSWLGI
ncbi:MAG TPA: tripartite tricarboxylate transporter TctB family protein [candidate division Zixibacteria bacterium]|nr:tripartite tricarboxylate transporter TctB family protein [candidate division Zixibacteria bacterium]